MIKNKKILIVGAGGFIGGHLVKKLLSDGNEIITSDIKPKEYWFQDFEEAKTKIGGMSPKEWMDWMFDHTVIVAEDDPFLPDFEMLKSVQPRGKQYEGPFQLRIVPATGAEKFAEFIFHKLNNFVKTETNERVRVTQVEFMEHNKNSAIYCE